MKKKKKWQQILIILQEIKVYFFWSPEPIVSPLTNVLQIDIGIKLRNL